ncbi:MAG: TauD/TfdA family dioxygenase [Alphaproteobacteria bacterium]
MTATMSSTPFKMTPLTDSFGVEISGVDLSNPLSGPEFDRIYEAFLAYQVLVFRGQKLEPAEQVAFARQFGAVQVHVMNQYHADGFPEIYYLSNLDADGKPSGKHPDKGTVHWHTDGSWSRRTGQATILYADRVPSQGGGTRFASMYDAYDTLDDATRERLTGLRAIHSLDFSRTRRHGEDLMTEAQKKARPPVDHPIIRTHPETGRKCVFLGDHAWKIDGMPLEEGRALIEDLNTRIIDDDKVYTHHWQVGDLILWDNRCTLHKAETYDTAAEPRVLRRCTITGEVPI